MIRWDAPGPYVVGFTNRQGGVSGGAYESLNLGALTEDKPENVTENRRRACAAIGADAERATMAWQHHGAEVTRAEPRGIVTPGTVFERCDGLWSEEPGQAMMLLTADCLPLAVARANGAKPARHPSRRGAASWPGSSRAARAPRRREACAAIGPGIGPCCYEVAEELARPFARGTATSSPTPRSTSGAQPSRLSAEAGAAERSSAPTLAPTAIPSSSFPPPRQGPHGPPGRRCLYRLTPSGELRAHPRRARPRITIVAATKYVDIEDRRPRRGRDRGRRREPRPGPRGRSTRATEMPSDGTSSVTCRAARRRPSTSCASSATRWQASPPPGGSRSRRSWR